MDTDNNKKVKLVETTDNHNTQREMEWLKKYNVQQKILSNNKINNTRNRDFNNKHYKNNIAF